MKKLTFIALLLGSVGLIFACSGNEVETTSTTVTTTRAAEESVLRSGTCDSSDIDIDHAKNTAKFTYYGHPGDKVSLNIVMKDGSSTKQSFELDDTNTSWQVPTTIYNGNIDHVEVHATGRTGQPGSCQLPVG